MTPDNVLRQILAAVSTEDNWQQTVAPWLESPVLSFVAARTAPVPLGRRSRLRRLVQLRIAAAFAMIVSVSGCGHESGAPTSPSSSTATASAVVVSGTAPFVGTTAQFVATATLSNSASQSVTTQAAWSSSNTTIATVSNNGTVTGVAAGDVDITATYQNVAGHAHVTITSVPNYQGFWRGDYSATACDGVNGLCDPGDLGVGSVHSTYLQLMQNGATVTGIMSIGLKSGIEGV